MAEKVSTLLRQSLGHLAEDVPDSYRCMLDALGPLVVNLDVDGEPFSLRGNGRLEVTEGRTGTADVQISTSRLAIIDVLDAKTCLAEAVEASTVCVRGQLEHVQRAHDVLLAYVHAAARAPRRPALLSALKAGVP